MLWFLPFLLSHTLPQPPTAWDTQRRVALPQMYCEFHRTELEYFDLCWIKMTEPFQIKMSHYMTTVMRFRMVNMIIYAVIAQLHCRFHSVHRSKDGCRRSCTGDGVNLRLLCLFLHPQMHHPMLHPHLPWKAGQRESSLWSWQDSPTGTVHGSLNFRCVCLCVCE